MSKQKFERVALDLHHPADWIEYLTPERMRALLGRGRPVPESWFVDVLGAVEIDLRGIREALACVTLTGGLPLSEAHHFAKPKPGRTWASTPYGCAVRVQDYALRALKNCGAVAYDKTERTWRVTPCEWVQAPVQ